MFRKHLCHTSKKVCFIIENLTFDTLVSPKTSITPHASDKTSTVPHKTKLK